MASATYSFGNYGFNTGNGVYAGPYTEMHVSQRDLTIMKTVASRGILVLNGTNQGKIVTIEGVLVGVDDDDLTNKARAMAVALMKLTENLIIEKDDETFIYENAVLENPETLFGTRYGVNDSHMRFKASFICPQGFARSTTYTTELNTNITSAPYTGNIYVEGDTSPEPVITVTIVDASSITELYFTNTTTNMQIAVTDITFEDGDIVVFDSKEKQVTHNGSPVVFDGQFPDFLPGLNEYQFTIAGSGSLLISQTAYDAEQSVYGARRIAQSFQVTGAQSISQLGLLLKKIEAGTTKVVYDLFSDGTINSALWATSGRVAETGGYLSLTASEGGDQTTNATATTDNKTGDPIYGFSADFSWDGNRGNDDSMYMELTDGTNYIRFQLTHTPDKVHLLLGGSYGSGEVVVWDANGGNMEVYQSGSNILIYGGGVLRHTITGDSIEPNSYLNIIAGANGGGGETIKLNVDNVYIYESTLTNQDITVEIQTNNAGAPSGSVVTNGSLTIPASEVGTSFAEIIKEFATAPSLSGSTTYHIVIYQSGGDVNNYYVVKKNSTSVEATGNFETSVDSGANWVQQSAQDMYFKLWGAYPTSYELELAISYYKSLLNVV